VSDPKKFWNCKNVLHHCAKIDVVQISPDSGAARNVDDFLSVCLVSIMFLNVRVCLHDFTMKALEYRTVLIVE